MDHTEHDPDAIAIDNATRLVVATLAQLGHRADVKTDARFRRWRWLRFVDGSASRLRFSGAGVLAVALDEDVQPVAWSPGTAAALARRLAAKRPAADALLTLTEEQGRLVLTLRAEATPEQAEAIATAARACGLIA